MILFLLYLYLINRLVEGQEPSVDFSAKKCAMCEFRGHLSLSNPILPDLEPEGIPAECEVIVYSRFSIDKFSMIDVDVDFLQEVTSLNKPVIVSLRRQYRYGDWVKVLESDGLSTETEVLCEFASKNNIQGYLLRDLSPMSDFDTVHVNVSQNIIPYLTQLKCTPDFIIGVTIEPYPIYVKNPCIYNYSAMNDLVDFYEINTYKLNDCVPEVYNGRTPLQLTPRGDNYALGMEEVACFLQATAICETKVYYAIEIFPMFVNATSISSYSEVCTGNANESWCVQNTKNFFDKGKFALDHSAGVNVKLIDLDDVKNDCGCEPFIGLQNIIAGFTGGSPSPCDKFDIQTKPID